MIDSYTLPQKKHSGLRLGAVLMVNGPLFANLTLITHPVIGSFLGPVLGVKGTPSFFVSLDEATILINDLLWSSLWWVLLNGGRLILYGLVDRYLDIFGTNINLFDLRLEILPYSGKDLLPSLSIFTILEVFSDLLIVALAGPGVVQAPLDLF